MNQVIAFKEAALALLTRRIRDRLSRIADSRVEQGRELQAVQTELGRREFRRWIEAEFGMSYQEADYLMTLAKEVDAGS